MDYYFVDAEIYTRSGALIKLVNKVIKPPKDDTPVDIFNDLRDFLANNNNVEPEQVRFRQFNKI